MTPEPVPGRTMVPLVPALVMLGLVAGAHGDSKPVFIKVPEDQTGLSGGVASFVCQATGEPKPRITWMKKGKKVSSQRFEVIEFDDGAGSVLRIQPLRVQRDEAIYECTATNSLGEINTSAKLSVLEGMCQGGTWHGGQRLMCRKSQPASPVPPWTGVCLAEKRTGHPGVDEGQQWTGMVIGSGLDCLALLRPSVYLVSLYFPVDQGIARVGSKV